MISCDTFHGIKHIPLYNGKLGATIIFKSSHLTTIVSKLFQTCHRQEEKEDR